MRIQARVLKWLSPFFSKMVFQTIQDYSFTMRSFIDFRVTGEAKHLRKYRVPIPNAVLRDAATRIAAEYVDLSKDEELTRVKISMEYRVSLSKRYFILRAAGIALENPWITDEQRAGIHHLLTSNGIKGRDMDKRILSELNAIKVRLDEHEQSSPKQGDKKPVTRSDFMNIFSYLAKENLHVGLDTPVIQYIEMLNVFKEQREQMEKTLKKYKSHGRVPVR